MSIKKHLHLKLEVHIIYWIVFTLFFTIIWGTYDNDYKRNFSIQLFSLPARLILVYGTLGYLFPKFLLREKYILFIISYIGLLLCTSIGVQRTIVFFVVQHTYLPFQSDSFFVITELMNTIIDVNLAAVIPLGYAFIKIWEYSREKNAVLQKQHSELLAQQEEQYIYLKSKSQMHKVALKDIMYIESLKNYIKVKTLHTDIICHKSISSMQEVLPKKTFIRVHRSFIISLHHMESFTAKLIYLQGNAIPIGRKYSHTIKELLQK